MLHALPVAALTIPTNSAARANHAKSAKHIVGFLSHVFFQTRTHLHQHKIEDVFKTPFVQRTKK